MSVIGKFVSQNVEEIQQMRMNLVSQWIKGISKVLQKLFKYCNGTAKLTPFALPWPGVLLVILTSNLKDS